MRKVSSNGLISDSTARNWDKLNASSDGRLTRRANKRNSEKRILPLEYFANPENAEFVRRLTDAARAENRSIFSTIFSLCVNKLKKRRLLEREHVQKTLRPYFERVAIFEDLTTLTLPNDEIDLLGLVYQAFQFEGQKNARGSYYTPRSVVAKMLETFDFSNGATFFDPCCGSGAFLTAVAAPSPRRLFGVDSDEIAVLIAKTNLLLKYPRRVFEPQIFCADFFEISSRKFPGALPQRFDYVATNPPWGAVGPKFRGLVPEISSNETFSAFFVRAFERLRSGGTIRFLFPESILNVKAHRDIRSFILDKTRLVEITAFDAAFSGVSTKFVAFECVKPETSESPASPSAKSAPSWQTPPPATSSQSLQSPPPATSSQSLQSPPPAKSAPTFVYRDKNGAREIPIETAFETTNRVFNFWSPIEREIIRKAREKGAYSLAQSRWGLGVVTGDNRRRLSPTPFSGAEPILSGKEIERYSTKPARFFLEFDRSRLQQAAPDEIYRADAKLVYKFVSKKLAFALDVERRLCLNSANILIPNVPNMSIKTVLAFLNSELFQFLHSKMFGEIKVLRGNLSELPFPRVSSDDDAFLSRAVDAVLAGDVSADAAIQAKIFQIFDLTQEQIACVRGV